MKRKSIFPQISKNIFSAILLFSFVFPISAQTNNTVNILSPENRFRFANGLFCEGDYIRAIDEYRNFLRSANNDTARFKMAYGLAKLNRYAEAGDNYKTLFFNSQFEDESRLEFVKSYFFSGNYSLFRKICSIKNNISERYSNETKKLLGISYMLEFTPAPDSNKFFGLFDEKAKAEMHNFNYRILNPNYKSELTAGLLSAAIPGLGKIYTEEYGDGITAFLMTGLFTFLAVDNFNHDHQFRAYLFSGLAAFFYAGNIYGSVSSAQIYNAGIRFNFDKDFKFYLNKQNYFMPEYKFLCR